MDYPAFSIVVPTYNRPSQLQGCLEALAKIDYPRDRYQVVVVDDGSVQPLDTVVEPFLSELEVDLLRQENAGPAAARNAGAQFAKGDYIAFTDDDCMPAADWLQQFAITLDSHPDAMIGGHTINALPHNLYSTASQALIDYIYEYYGSSSAGIFFASNNIAMSRSHFLEIGGFDVSFPLAAAEDRELCDRWQQRGYPMHYAPDATIQHAHALSLKSYWRQHFGYGRGAFCFHKARALRTAQTIKVEPVAFYTDLLTYPMKSGPAKSGGFSGPLQVSGLFFLSQVATAAGFFWEKLSEQRQQNSATSS